MQALSRAFRRWLIAAFLGGLSLTGASLAWAHDIPARVTVLAFVKPEGKTLRVLVRAPLAAMRDIAFPVKGPGYLDLARAEPLLRDAAILWIAGSLGLEEDGRQLMDDRITAIRVSLPSDRSFASYDGALAHVTGPPLAESTDIVWQQAMLDVLIEYPIASERSNFGMRPTLARLGIQTNTVVRFSSPGRAERAFQFLGDPGLLRLDPRWHQAALRFVRLGFLHILDGIDHLLFVLCLVIPFRKLRPLVAIVTAFTVAHSVTLIASTLGLAPTALWFPPLIEMLIALSILYMAFENIVGAKQERRWLLAFGFGLVHGFGFSFFLRDSLQFAGAHLATSLFAFNVGVELGQVFVLLLAIPVLNWLLQRIPERVGVILLSAIVAHSAWHWMTERWGTLKQYRFEWPVLDVVTLTSAVRALLLVAIVVGAGWGVLTLVRRLLRPGAQSEEVGVGR